MRHVLLLLINGTVRNIINDKMDAVVEELPAKEDSADVTKQSVLDIVIEGLGYSTGSMTS